MHELSIALNIVDICTEEARKTGAGKVSRVEVEIGSMAGVEYEALNFSWDVAVNNTIVEGAPLVIHKVQASGRCNNCGHEFPIEDFMTPCPSCGEFLFEVVKGKELLVKSISVESAADGGNPELISKDIIP